MKATKFIAAAVVFVAAGSAFAADAPLANAAVTAAAAATAAANSASADQLNIPTVTIGKSSASDRAAVKAEAVAFVRNHKTALAVQLEQYKN
ncbi:hypothetical protein HHL21_13100 [Massilia sp. RP-1-19]|uniref:DUF4148 domain-containing protein n=1 Tax=Massilia polaris TaxID=2728846 RepID=A0A848HLT4_9BURK|nr:hypothetical protein [Massilia polaris]NML61997.1 hypothetical protein [Massilia polaris]